MSVRRTVAVINAPLDLRGRFRYPDSNQVFDPSEISQVEIIDSATGDILQTITSITNISTGLYKVITSDSWNTTPRTIIDRWKFKKTSASDFEFQEGYAIITEVQAASSETSIVTLSEIKDFLEITAGDKDTLLNLLKGKCTSFIETLLNRKLSLVAHKELYSGSGETKLIIDNIPVDVVSVLSQSLDFENKTYQSPISDNLMFIQNASGIIELFSDSFLPGQKNVYIEYTAGYDTDDMPPDLKLVVLELIAKKFYDVDEKRFGITTKNVMGENINFVITDISKANQDLIKAYRKMPSLKGVTVTGWSEV